MREKQRERNIEIANSVITQEKKERMELENYWSVYRQMFRNIKDEFSERGKEMKLDR